ncbi:MAG: restriction endonuclease [Acidobacteriota bacterium]|nr:restriction endonuclease [Acidobacteriota bacterium]
MIKRESLAYKCLTILEAMPGQKLTMKALAVMSIERYPAWAEDKKARSETGRPLADQIVAELTPEIKQQMIDALPGLRLHTEENPHYFLYAVENRKTSAEWTLPPYEVPRKKGAKQDAARIIAEHFGEPYEYHANKAPHFTGKGRCLLKESQVLEPGGSHRIWTSLQDDNMQHIQEGAALAWIVASAEHMFWIPSEVFLSWTPRLVIKRKQGQPVGYNLRAKDDLTLITADGSDIDLKPYRFPVKQTSGWGEPPSMDPPEPEPVTEKHEEQPVDEPAPFKALVKKQTAKTRKLLHELLLSMEPYAFEHLVKHLLVEMGYKNARVTPLSGDKGADVIADIELGISSVREAVEVKQHSSKIGRDVLDKLRGSLHRFNAVRGTIVTTSGFSKDAIREAFSDGVAPITLIDGEKLIDLLIEHNIGVRKHTLEVLTVDEEALKGLVDAEDD